MLPYMQINFDCDYFISESLLVLPVLKKPEYRFVSSCCGIYLLALFLPESTYSFYMYMMAHKTTFFQYIYRFK